MSIFDNDGNIVDDKNISVVIRYLKDIISNNNDSMGI